MLYLLSAIPCFWLVSSNSNTNDLALTTISILFGFSLRGWTGLQQAELARTTPGDQISDVTGASVFIMFFGITLSGVVFAAIVDLTGGYRVGFTLLGVLSVVNGLIFRRMLCKCEVQSYVGGYNQD